MTSWFCDCWTALVGADPGELARARDEAAAKVYADQRVRQPATDSAVLPEVRFIFDLDADSEDQARARAEVVVREAVAGGRLEAAHWAFWVRIVG